MQPRKQLPDHSEPGTANHSRAATCRHCTSREATPLAGQRPFEAEECHLTSTVGTYSSYMNQLVSRRTLLRQAAAAAATLVLPAPVLACGGATPRKRAIPGDPNRERLASWTKQLVSEGLTGPELPVGRSVVRVGDLAAGSPYEPFTLEAYLKNGSPATEPLTLSLTRFDCVTLVEACLAVSRAARAQSPSWDEFGREVERMRYRDGHRQGYTSRLHYFSEWISDGARRGLVQDLGGELGGAKDERPLRFMTQHRAK